MIETPAKELTTNSSSYRAYKRVEADLRGRVSRGEWRPGATLPRRRDLAKEYKIDVNTLQRAILPLVNDGTLRAEGKRGTFVADRAPAATISLPTQAEREPDVERRSLTPTGSAESLESRSIGIVAHIVTGQAFNSDTSATHTRDSIRAIEWACTRSGGQSRVFNTYLAGGTGCGVVQATTALLQEGMDAIVILDIYDTPAVGIDLCSMPIPKDFPMVYVSSVGNFVPHLHVFYDQRHAGYLAASHLVQRGWTNITFVSPYRANWVEERLFGTRIGSQAGGANGSSFTVLSLNPTGDQYDPVDDQKSRDVIRKAISNDELSGGIVTANDDIARLIMTEAAAAGLRAGVDYAIVGFDDDIESSSSGLTSVRPPLEEMGAVAVRLLARRLSGESVNMHVCLRSQIVVRTSSAAKR